MARILGYLPEDWESPRCKRCGGYCVQVLVSYGGEAVEEWECTDCRRGWPVKPRAFREKDHAYKTRRNK